jgi:hypothetical protein
LYYIRNPCDFLDINLIVLKFSIQKSYFNIDHIKAIINMARIEVSLVTGDGILELYSVIRQIAQSHAQ